MPQATPAEGGSQADILAPEDPSLANPIEVTLSPDERLLVLRALNVATGEAGSRWAAHLNAVKHPSGMNPQTDLHQQAANDAHQELQLLEAVYAQVWGEPIEDTVEATLRISLIDRGLLPADAPAAPPTETSLVVDPKVEASNRPGTQAKPGSASAKG